MEVQSKNTPNPHSFQDAGLRDARLSPCLFHPHFTFLGLTQLPDIHATGFRLRHASGAELVAILDNNPVQSFALSFDAAPRDDSGWVHVAEHLHCNTSTSHPRVHDIMTVAARGGHYLSLNASTDYDQATFYVTSAVPHEYLRLSALIIDSVFQARSSKLDFAIEGWRVKIDRKNRPLVRGITYSEACGAEGDPEEAMRHAILSTLLPNSHYRHSFCGIPKAMLLLKHEELIKRAKQLFHPSQAKLFVSGKLELPEILQAIDFALPKVFEPFTPEVQLDTTPVAEPIRQHFAYPYFGAAADAPSASAIAWVIPPEGNNFPRVALDVLETLLVTRSDPNILERFEEAGLNCSLCGGIMRLRQNIFQLEGWGVNQEQRGDYERCILEWLHTLTQRMFTTEEIEWALNTVELDYREKLAEPQSGESLRDMVLESWNLHGSPFEGLRWKSDMEALRKTLAREGRLFERMIQELLLDNHHRTTVSIEPSTDTGSSHIEQENAFLKNLDLSENGAFRKECIEQEQQISRLSRRRENDQALACFPPLELSLLNREIPPMPIFENVESEKIVIQRIPARDLVAIEIFLDLTALDASSFPYAMLLPAVLQKIINTSPTFALVPMKLELSALASETSADQTPCFHLILRGTCLALQGELFAENIRKLLRSPLVLSSTALRECVSEARSELYETFFQSEDTLAKTRACALLSTSWQRQDLSEGIRHFRNLRACEEEINKSEKNCLEVLDHVNRAYQASLASPNTSIHVIEPDNQKSDLSSYFRGLLRGSSDPSSHTRFIKGVAQHLRAEGIVIPTRLTSTAVALDLRAVGHHPHGALSVLLNQLHYADLWRAMRVRGSAYGVSAEYGEQTGILSFGCTYCPDPELALRTMRRIPRIVDALALSESDLRRAKVGAIREVDMPLSPLEIAHENYLDRLLGISHAQKQNRRGQIFDCTLNELRAYASVFADALAKHSAIAVLGERTLLEGIKSKFALEISEL